MSQLAKRLLLCGGFILVFSAITGYLAFSVTYKPYGVSDARREEYEKKITFLRQREQAILEKRRNDENAVVEVAEMTHDFGTVDPHQSLEHRFQIRNVGTTPLTLSIRETSCKCTVGKLGIPVVMPGEETTATLTWNTGYKSEDYEQVAVLETNDPARNLLRLSVRGTVRADLIVPESVALPKADLGDASSTKFVVYSQLWDDFTVSDIESDLDDVNWSVRPLEQDDSRLADLDPRSAWEVLVERPILKTGEFSGTITIKVDPSTGEESLEKTVVITGGSRSPIAFLSPEIKKPGGLDVGTLTSDKDHHFYLTVQVRSDVDRKIKVLDFEPKILKVSLGSTKRPGFHKLTVTVPKGAPLTRFNLDESHGFVSVGDPDNDTFRNWFPLFGAVAPAE